MVSRISYDMVKGNLWDRLVIIKNRRTHRIIKPTDARCTVDFGTSKYTIPTSISREGGIYLTLTPDQTLDFPVGTLNFDVTAPIRDYWQVVAKGTITVTAADNITPIKDGQVMEIRLKKGEDWRETISWTDSSGSLIAIQNAYMQAKNSAGTKVIDLRWFATKPTEVAIAALPGAQRGYLAPYTGETLEMHISDLNTVTAGTYPFDLFVQPLSGDWVFLSGGSVVVEASVSEKP
jgi:hypothetical protein